MKNDESRLAQLAQAVEVLNARVKTLESRHAETERKAEIVQAAQRSWRPLLQVQGDLLLASEAGATCRVPLAVCRTIAAGRPLDLDVRDADDDAVELVDPVGRVLASLPRVALLALPRVLAGPDARGILELAVRFRAVRESGTVPARSPATPARRPVRPTPGVPGRADYTFNDTQEPGAIPDLAGLESGTSPRSRS